MRTMERDYLWERDGTEDSNYKKYWVVLILFWLWLVWGKFYYGY